MFLRLCIFVTYFISCFQSDPFFVRPVTAFARGKAAFKIDITSRSGARVASRPLSGRTAMPNRAARLHDRDVEPHGTGIALTFTHTNPVGDETGHWISRYQHAHDGGRGRGERAAAAAADDRPAVATQSCPRAADA